MPTARLFVTGRLKAVLVVGGRKFHAEESRRVRRSSPETADPAAWLRFDRAGGQELAWSTRRRSTAEAGSRFAGAAIRLTSLWITRCPSEPWCSPARAGSRKHPAAKCAAPRAATVLDGTLPTLYEWRPSRDARSTAARSGSEDHRTVESGSCWSTRCRA